MPTTDLRTLKSRPCGAGAGQQTLVVAQDDFGVGAHIHQQGDFVGEVGPLGEQHARGVGPHVARDAGQNVDPRTGVQFQIDLAGRHVHGAVHRQSKRRTTEFHRVDAHQQVMHDGIADERGFQNVLGRDARLSGNVTGELVERGAHGVRHVDLAAGVHHHVRDAAHQVFAKANLWVHHTSRGHHFAGFQVAQMGRDGRGAHVHRHAEQVFVQAGPHRDDALAGMHRHGDLPAPFAQDRLQHLQHLEVAPQVGQTPFKFERVFQATQVA